jgi:PAS domain-containing protein
VVRTGALIAAMSVVSRNTRTSDYFLARSGDCQGYHRTAALSLLLETSPLSRCTTFSRSTSTERIESLPHGVRVEQLHSHAFGSHELLNRLGAIVWEADPLDFRTIFVSQQAEDVLGYPLRDWHEDAFFFERKLCPGDGHETIARLRQIVSEGGDHVLELRMIASDGSPVSLRVFLRSVCDWRGRPRSLHGIMIDVGSRRSEARSNGVESPAEALSSEASGPLSSGRGYGLPLPPRPEVPAQPGVDLNRLLRSLERPLPDRVRAALDASGRRSGGRAVDQRA